MKDFLFFSGGIALPLITLITGIILWLKPPERNSFFGFRTKLSMSGDELWYAAQRYCGRLLTAVFAPLTVIAAAVSAAALGMDSDGKFIAICVMTGVEIIALAAVNIAAERRLKKEGERHGREHVK